PAGAAPAGAASAHPRVLLPPAPSGAAVEGLAWLPPDRLLVLRGGGLLLLDRDGRLLSSVPRPEHGRFAALTASPMTRTAAFVRRDPRTGTNVVWSVRFPRHDARAALGPVAPTPAPARRAAASGAAPRLFGGRARIAFAGTGTVRSLAFSPDGRWLAFAWPPSDQWIFQRVDGRPRLATVERVAERLGHIGLPADSAIAGWAR
ncbi:hypothetical protein VSS74_08800, partial [Conexibacter stalactiti]